MLFHPANLPYWIFLGFGVGLLLLVILAGGGETEADMEVDLDTDLDITVEMGAPESLWDLDTDTDVEADGDIGLIQVLGWLGVGKVPLVLLLAIDLCFWGLIGWVLNVTFGNLLGAIPTRIFGWGGLIFFGSLALSLTIGGWLARPLGLLFAAFGEDASSERLIGCGGTVSSAAVPPLRSGKIGQVDVIDAAHNLVTVNAVLPEWASVVPRRGAPIWVIDYRDDQGYVVIAKDSIDEQQWFAQGPARPISRKRLH